MEQLSIRTPFVSSYIFLSLFKKDSFRTKVLFTHCCRRQNLRSSLLQHWKVYSLLQKTRMKILPSATIGLKYFKPACFKPCLMLEVQGENWMLWSPKAMTCSFAAFSRVLCSVTWLENPKDICLPILVYMYY